MRIESRPLDQIRPYGGNPRTIPESAIAKVAASLERFGWRQPIVVDREGVVVAGHVRLLAAQRLGMAEVPVHVAEGLSEDEIRAYRLADNRSAQEARWDDGLLGVELAALAETDLAQVTGFDPAELDRHLGELRFDPAGDDEQGKLDETNAGDEVVCPACGHRFHA